MHVMELLTQAVEKRVSDIFIISNFEPAFRVESEIVRTSFPLLRQEDARRLVEEIYELANGRDMTTLLKTGDDDFSFSLPGLGRFRANTCLQRGTVTAVIRVVLFELPDPEQLGIPPQVMDLVNSPKGMVLITGSAGSGKSTTLACMIDKINSARACHIITMEDPIEYLHRHKKSIVTQREIGGDSVSYVAALRAVLRQSPDVILLGEMRDFETIEIAMTAAEAGQLIFSTLHTTGAANTIDRIVDIFPVNQQQQIRLQLSMVLRAVVYQQLIPSVDGKLVPAFEVMVVNPAIRNMIREAKTYQMDSAIFAGAAAGMCTMDASLLELFRAGRITGENAVLYSLHPEEMQKKIS